MKKLGLVLMIIGLVIAGSGIASADLLFDRGLPTLNLNNAAAGNRSNVAWADWESSNNPSEYWLSGDDVVLTKPGTYHIDTVRVWTTSDPTGLYLLAGSSLSNAGTFTSYTSTKVTYNGGSNYQGQTNNYDIYQLDFAINQNVTSGTYYFFLGGPWASYPTGGYVSPFLHASNEGLSGSTQQGADDTFQYLRIKSGSVVGVESWYSGDGGGTTGWASGWDKNSDGNVQVYGTQVPEPSILLLLGFGMVGLVAFGRKVKK
jgi:hypothetical protein